MEPLENVSLAQYSTMKLGGRAAYLLEITDPKIMIEAISSAKNYNLPIIMIGSGSNIIWRDEGFPGLVLINRIKGFKIIEEDETNAYIEVGAGEVWDSVVGRCVDMGFSGIECLSLIPGTAGATPIQNVGAYGQEISQVLVTITAYDLQTGTLVILPASDCGFNYRTSRFNNIDKGRFYITAITLLVRKTKPMPPFYSAVEIYFKEHGITDYTTHNIRQAVIDIRRHKLPDPNLIANCGSFFANPIIDRSLLSTLEETYPAVPHWSVDNEKVKLSAAWLIDQAGYHDFYDPETGIATYPQQSLVIVNRSAKTTGDLLAFTDRLKASIKAKFNIELIQEPQLLP